MSEVTAEKSGGKQTPTCTATIIHLQQVCAHWNSLSLSMKLTDGVVIFAGKNVHRKYVVNWNKLEYGITIFLNLDCQSFARVSPRAFMHENE